MFGRKTLTSVVFSSELNYYRTRGVVLMSRWWNEFHSPVQIQWRESWHAQLRTGKINNQINKSSPAERGGVLAPLCPWQATPCHLLDFFWLSLKQLRQEDETAPSQGADCHVGGCVCESRIDFDLGSPPLLKLPLSPFALADAPSTTGT